MRFILGVEPPSAVPPRVCAAAVEGGGQHGAAERIAQEQHSATATCLDEIRADGGVYDIERRGGEIWSNWGVCWAWVGLVMVLRISPCKVGGVLHVASHRMEGSMHEGVRSILWVFFELGLAQLSTGAEYLKPVT